MTATQGLPAQQIAPSRPMRSAAIADQAQAGSPAPEGQGFEALFSRLRSEMEAAGPSAAEAGPGEGELQPRRSRETRGKPLEAEDVLPMEMLLTLYAQQQAVLPPQAAPAPALRNGDAQDASALTGLTAMQPMPVPDTAAAVMQAAPEVSTGEELAQAIFGLPKETASARTVPGDPNAFSASLPRDFAPLPSATPPKTGDIVQAAQTPRHDAGAQAAPARQDIASIPLPPPAPVPPQPANMALPADFAERLAAATRPAPAPPPAAKRADTLPMDAASSLAATEADATRTAPASVAPLSTAASAPSASPAAPVTPLPQMPAAFRTAGPMAEPRQTPPVQTADSRADEAATARSAFNALSVPPIDDTAGRDSAPPTPERLREMSAVVTRQEAVLPPAGQPPVAHQAAERIIAELQSSGNAASSDRAQAARPGDAPAPARTLHIQLHPADLGMLTVKLSMRDQMLDIKLEAAEHRTVRILEADREKLTEILRSAGYALDGVTVQIASPEKPVQTFNGMTGQGGDGQAQHGGQSQPGGSQADAQRGQGSQRGNEDRSFASRTDGGDHAPRRGPADGDLYL